MFADRVEYRYVRLDVPRQRQFTLPKKEEYNDTEREKPKLERLSMIEKSAEKETYWL